MIYCPNCRTQLNEQCNFCYNCGYKIQNICNNPSIVENGFNKHITNYTIKDLLKSNNNYNRKNKKAVKEMDNMIQQNEFAIFAFRGTLKTKDLYRNDYAFAHTTTYDNTSFTTITNNNVDRIGIICLTNKRTIFVTNSSWVHIVRQINNSDVTELILDKYLKAGLLQIKTIKEDFVFTGSYQSMLQYKNHLENLLKETF